MNNQEIYKIIQDSFDSLYHSEMISQKLEISDNTIIVGKGTILDSITLLTLFSEIEERLSEQTSKEIFINLADIHEFNTESNFLSVNILANYIQTII